MTHNEKVFNTALEELLKENDIFKDFTISDNGNFVSYSFLYKNEYTNIRMERIKEYVSENGYKISGDFLTAEFNINVAQKNYLVLSYDRAQDKINLKLFDVGYKYKTSQFRIYPYQKRTNVLTIKEGKIWWFRSMGRKTKVKQFIGTYKAESLKSLHNEFTVSYMLVNLYEGREPKSSRLMPLVTRHYSGVKDQLEIIDNLLGYKVSKTLKKCVFHLNDYYNMIVLISLLKDKNEFRSVINVITEALKRGYSTDFRMNFNFVVMTQVLKIKNQSLYIFEDWLRERKLLNKKMTLKMTSWKRIENEHRTFSRILRYKVVPDHVIPHKDFRGMFEDFKYETELIEGKKRLIQESEINDHCVYSYYTQINDGSCAIFSVKYQDSHYTLQVSREYRNLQFRGRLNCEPPKELVDAVEEYLKKYRLTHPLKQIKTPNSDQHVPVYEF